MAAYDQERGLRADFEEPTRTAEFGGVSEDEPPHHKLHTDDEPLPKPAMGSYQEDEGLPGYQPTPAGTQGRAGAPMGTEDYRDTEPTKFDERPADTQPRGDGMSGGYADSSDAFPGAPIDRKVEEPGYGNDTKVSEPAYDSSERGVDPEAGGPKKEGMMTKINEKLPGHQHKEGGELEPETAGGAPPKKGLMTKIKEKLPGHHGSSTTPATTE